MEKKKEMVDITLALGGGGSKGYAHLGVIRALEKRGYRIKAIAGTSAGGMAGAIIAAGFSPKDIIGKIAHLRQENLYGFGRGPSLLGTNGIEQIIHQFLGDMTFSELQIPCALTAVDLINMKEVNIQEGKVIDGVMATDRWSDGDYRDSRDFPSEGMGRLPLGGWCGSQSSSGRDGPVHGAIPACDRCLSYSRT